MPGTKVFATKATGQYAPHPRATPARSTTGDRRGAQAAEEASRIPSEGLLRGDDIDARDASPLEIAGRGEVGISPLEPMQPLSVHPSRSYFQALSVGRDEQPVTPAVLVAQLPDQLRRWNGVAWSETAGRG